MKAIQKFNQNNYSVIEAGYNGLSKSTQESYRYDLDLFNKIINKDITQIIPEDIIEYVKELQDRDYKNNSINRKIYSLSKILNLYKLQGLIKFNPVTELNKIKRITKKVENNIIQEVELSDIQIVLKKKNKTTIIIKTLKSTGMRISELINIKVDHIKDYSKNGRSYKRINITGKGNKERDIYITSELYQDIKDMFGKSRQGYLFQSRTGRPLSP